jgi:hypothetical protein
MGCSTCSRGIPTTGAPETGCYTQQSPQCEPNFAPVPPTAVLGGPPCQSPALDNPWAVPGGTCSLPHPTNQRISNLGAGLPEGPSPGHALEGAN